MPLPEGHVKTKENRTVRHALIGYGFGVASCLGALTWLASQRVGKWGFKR